MSSLTLKKYKFLADSFMLEAFGFDDSDFDSVLQYYSTVEGKVEFEDPSDLVDCPNADIAAGCYIEEILHCINTEVFKGIKKRLSNGCVENFNIDQVFFPELLQACNSRINRFRFSLSIDGSISTYNELDEVEVRNTTIDRIVEDVLPIFVENVRGQSNG